MTDPLKPCPFCGGQAVVERPGTSRASCIVACSDCGCRVESNELGFGTDWNRRAYQLAPPPDVLPLAEQDRHSDLRDPEVYRRALDASMNIALAVKGAEATPREICDASDRVAAERERRGGK